MSAQLPGINAGQIGGITGVDGSSQQGVDAIELAKQLGGMGAMNLLQSSRQLNVHFNGVNVALALEQREKDSTKKVIESLGA